MTTETEEDAAVTGVTTTRLMTHRDAVAALVRYCEHRNAAKKAKASQDAVGDQLKGWLHDHDGERGEELRDGEHNITARLQRREGSPQLDAPNATTDHLRWLADHGCLKLDYTTFKNLVEKFSHALDINRTLMPGGETVALDVQEGK